MALVTGPICWEGPNLVSHPLGKMFCMPTRTVAQDIRDAAALIERDVYSHSVPSMEAEAAETIASLVRGKNS